MTIFNRTINLITEASQPPWIGVFLKILSLCYFYGATIHYLNLLGFGEFSFAEEPLSWQIGDISYAILDTFTFIGLWLKKPWGVGCFLLGAISQLILYLGFPHFFAFTPEHRQALRTIVIFHLVSLTIFVGLFTAKK